MSYKEDALTFLGITRWHELGYTGKGIKIMSDELIYQKAPSGTSQERWDKIICPKGYRSKAGDTPWHGTAVMSHILMVAPDAECIAFPLSGSFGSTYNSACAEYIKENKVHIFTTSSVGSYPVAGRRMAIEDCIEAGCIFFGSAGNDGESGVREEIQYEGYWAIGGVKPKFTGEYNGEDPIYDWGKLTKVGYSAVGEELDYVTIAEIMTAVGTSFCSPVFAAMVGLVQQFFIEKIGRRLTRREMANFIADNLRDLEVEGFDTRTGHGSFILPEPSTIDIRKYVADIDVAYPNEGIYYGGFPEVRSDVVMRGIDKLHPELQVCVNKFLEECKSRGLDVCITETLRTQEEQEALYAQGRTTSGKIVTNCRGFQSPHCWGVAFDFCRNVKGKEYDNSDKFFDYVGEIAKTIFDDTEYDLFWGGDFKTFVDKPHIEMKKYLPNNSTVWLIDHFGTPEEFMATWYDMKEEGGNYVHRYKTIEEMPVYAQDTMEELVNEGILAGKGGELGLDLTEDMIRTLMLCKKMIDKKGE
jgi:peptidoglycan L-alanyl-D-glutamate endopeptidase CwlK